MLCLAMLLSLQIISRGHLATIAGLEAAIAPLLWGRLKLFTEETTTSKICFRT